jgi:hypothetical protein
VSPVKVIVRKWSRAQGLFMTATERFVDFEGAIRAGKTTPLIWKMINYCVEYPGIHCMLARWTGDALDAQLKPKFYEECPRELLLKWNAREEFQEFTNGSRIYIRSLKSADDTARYAKFAGLTLAVIGIDQPEELPADVYFALKGRLSQPGFPQQLLLTPNPPGSDHWLVDEFPEENNLKNHLYLHTSVYDNRDVLGDEYIEELEREYPPGSAMRRRMIDGLRGLSIVGDAVYGKVFSRDLHVQPLDYMPDFALIEAWDFGHKHPAVSWSQFLPFGGWNVLAEWMGHRQFLDEAVPAVAALRAELFPSVTTLRVCCDPAGAGTQGHGIRQTAVDVLNKHLRQLYGPQMGARFTQDANRPEKREWAIQQISGYMSRIVRGRPALLIHPRCGTLIDGFEAGYVFDDRKFINSRLPNVRKPKKDGFYDHLQNTVEYAMLNYGTGVVSVERRRPEPDLDEDDIRPPVRRRRGRAGY